MIRSHHNLRTQLFLEPFNIQIGFDVVWVLRGWISFPSKDLLSVLGPDENRTQITKSYISIIIYINIIIPRQFGSAFGICLVSVSVMFPWIAPYLGKIGITFISKDAVDFFSEVTKKAMEIRKGSDDQVW